MPAIVYAISSPCRLIAVRRVGAGHDRAPPARMMSITIFPLPPVGSTAAAAGAIWLLRHLRLHPRRIQLEARIACSVGSSSKSLREPAPEIIGQKMRPLLPNSCTTSS